MPPQSPGDRPPRVLLLMATQTYRAGAFLEAAAKLGLQAVAGTQATHALSHLNPAGHLALDFHDLEGATDRIVEFAALHPLDAIVSTEDEGALLAAMASDALTLRHSPLLAVRRARDKYQTRQTLAAAGLHTPEFHRFSVNDDPRRIVGQVGFPCVVKPLALAASRGVIRADDPDQFVAAFQRVAALLRGLDSGQSRVPDLGWILVEGYIPGAEVAVEGLIQEGELTVLAMFDKPDSLEGPFFEETLYITPSRHPTDVQGGILQATRHAIAALGLSEGPIHAELRVNDEGAWILEVAPRSIGGYCSRALRFEGGAGLEELILQQALDRPLTATLPASPASGVMMIPIPAAGVLCEVHGIDQAQEVPGIEEIRMVIPIGQPVLPPPEGSQYLGFLFARGESPAFVEAALRQAHGRLGFVIQSPERATIPGS